ncbi:unnamed protein product [Brassica rapa subsp. trilocularis]
MYNILDGHALSATDDHNKRLCLQYSGTSDKFYIRSFSLRKSPFEALKAGEQDKKFLTTVSHRCCLRLTGASVGVLIFTLSLTSLLSSVMRFLALGV